ncbi:MAG TPA: hypothetical protein VFF48_10530 [Brevundimonas sp.]|nr:hypothetical protein [Brevundimonas sp.]
MSTTREDILHALAALLATRPDFFPPAAVDEPEPTSWTPADDPAPNGRQLMHAAAVQDGPPPDHLGFVRGAEGEALDELELEAAISYGVNVKPGHQDGIAECRVARRIRRDAAVDLIAELIAADRTLGLGPEVYADVRPADRQDDVAFPNALPSATAVVPIRVLYPAAHAAA